MRRVAIIGAGFAGLAVCWELLFGGVRHFEVVVFDERGVGGGASGVAPGLLHGYVGQRCRLNAFALEGVAATRRLLLEAQGMLGRAIFREEGILRVPASPEQRADFMWASDNYPGVEWWPKERCCEVVGGSVEGGIWIRGGMDVRAVDYLRGLWMACASRGGVLRKERVGSVESLEDFDYVVIAAGAHSGDIKGGEDLRCTKIKGQAITLRWPHRLKPPAMPVVGRKYLVMDESGERCVVGATYERAFADETFDLEVAKADLLPDVIRLFPELAESQILGGAAGFRASPPGQRLPLIKQMGSKLFGLTGFGSRGLLYHALYAKQLCDKLRAL